MKATRINATEPVNIKGATESGRPLPQVRNRLRHSPP